MELSRIKGAWKWDLILVRGDSMVRLSFNFLVLHDRRNYMGILKALLEISQRVLAKVACLCKIIVKQWVLSF